MRQNGLLTATKWVKRCDITGAPRGHCDKTGAGSLFAQHSVAKGANPPQDKRFCAGQRPAKRLHGPLIAT
jgi:hypothetical protein